MQLEKNAIAGRVERIVRPPATKKPTIGKIAADYMRQHDYKFVMLGDAHLLHEIADVAGIPHKGFDTEIRVLNALDRSNEFVKGYVRVHRLVRCFYLPEHAASYFGEAV